MKLKQYGENKKPSAKLDYPDSIWAIDILARMMFPERAVLMQF